MPILERMDRDYLRGSTSSSELLYRYKKDELIQAIAYLIDEYHPDLNPFRPIVGWKAISEFTGWSVWKLNKYRPQLMSYGCIGYWGTGYQCQRSPVLIPYWFACWMKERSHIENEMYRTKGKQRGRPRKRSDGELMVPPLINMEIVNA